MDFGGIELGVHTDRGFYYTGDTIFGCLYLRSDCPQKNAEVITLRFVCEERFMEANGIDFGMKKMTLPQFSCVENQLTPFSENYTLAYYDTGIPKGHFMIPFQICVPPGLPPTFQKKKRKGKLGVMSIKYKLTVEISGIELRTHYDILISEKFKSHHLEPMEIKLKQGFIPSPIQALLLNSGELDCQLSLHRSCFSTFQNISASLSV
jgi:hypothetical protein